MPSYPHPPITEALFEIQVDLPAGVKISAVEAVCEKTKNNYPKKRPRRRMEGRFEVRNGQPVNSETIDLGVDGFLNWAEDEKQVVQYRLDGFTFSRLLPYKRWEESFPEAMRLWEIYSSDLKPVLVRRIAVRYINTIKIPLKSFNLDEYLVNAPQAPTIEGTLVENFLSRVAFNISRFNARGVVTQTIGQTSSPSFTPIIFDLEAFSDVNIAPDQRVIQEVFSGLRSLKNEIFESSLHQKTKELFNKEGPA